ncbi:MAG TPA: hypothetical protein VIK72_09855 [Clostridiaceae bacterium]
MIHAFCNKTGSGKTKDLINLANERVDNTKGDIVYIDYKMKSLFQLNRKIRYIATEEFNLKTYKDFYGFLCGILSENYDVDNIFIDGIFNIVGETSEDAAHLFYSMEVLAQRYNIEFYVNVNSENEYLPDFVKKYVA